MKTQGLSLYLRAIACPPGAPGPTPHTVQLHPPSPKEVGSSGVPSPLVATSMQIQFIIAVSLPRVGSISAKAVAVDVVDMLVGKDHVGQFIHGGDRA